VVAEERKVLKERRAQQEVKVLKARLEEAEEHRGLRQK